jgi:hypothetical protein
MASSSPTASGRAVQADRLTEVTPNKYKSDNCRPKPDQAQNAFCWAQANNAHRRLAFVRLFFFTSDPAFSQWAWVIGYSAGMAGVTIAPCKTRAIIAAKSFIAIGFETYRDPYRCSNHT